MQKLLKATEVDELLRYAAGRTLKLAKAGKIAFVCLPDGAIRFDEQEIQRILQGRSRQTLLGAGP
jgi:predicted site-specific integrase-resolvase